MALPGMVEPREEDAMRDMMRSSGNGSARGHRAGADGLAPDTLLSRLRIARDPDGARPSPKQQWFLQQSGLWRDDLTRRQAHWLIGGLKSGVVGPNGV